MSSIVSFCRESRGQYDAPPNDQALWLRIRNTVESEHVTNAAAQNPTRQARRESWLSRSMRRSWELSFSQMVTAVVAIIIFASLATVFSLRSLQNNSGSATTNLNSTGGQTVALTTSNGGAQVFELKDRPWQQQQINYLTQVVEQHKSHWNPQVRADFERNLDLLDQTVNESLQKLSVHPHDDVTEEMLNAACDGRPDDTTAERAVRAAELVAATSGEPPDELSPEDRDWAETHGLPPDELVELA